MAAGVLKVAHEMGISVPEQLSIAGFDDNLLASRVIPSLTTIQRPVSDMAQLAAKKIIAAIEGAQVGHRGRILSETPPNYPRVHKKSIKTPFIY